MKNWWKWLLGIVAFILVVLSLGGWYLSKHWSPIIDQKLKELVHKSSHGLYTLTYSSKDINPSFGNVTFDNVELIPDSAVYQKLVEQKKAPDNQFHVKLKTLQVKHFSLADLFFNRKLSISSVRVEKPDVHVLSQRHTFNHVDSVVADKESLHDHIKHVFNSISVGSIIVDTVDFTVVKREGDTLSTMAFSKMNLQLDDLLIDASSSNDTSRFFFTKAITLYIPAFSYDLSGGLYTVAIKDFKVNTKLGLASIGKTIVIPNEEVYKLLVKDKKAPASQLSLAFDSLNVKGVNLSNILTHKVLALEEIVFDNPTVELTQHKYDSNTKNSSAGTKGSLYDYVKEFFVSVSVSKMDMGSVNLRYTTVDRGNKTSIALKKVNLKVEDVKIDSSSAQDMSRVFYAKMIDLKVPNFSYDVPHSLYRVAFENLHVNTKDNYISLANLVYKPKVSKAEFFRIKNKNVTMNDVSLGSLRLNQVDFLRLINNQVFSARTATVSNGSAAFYQDLRYPRVYANKIGQDPYEQLMKMKSNFHIASVLVNNVSVSYSEHSARSDNVGVITFKNAGGTLSNVTNIRQLLAHNKYMRADLNAKVMGVGQLHVKFGFDMLRKGGYYTYEGTLSPMSATEFNRILEPLASVQLVSGNIKKIAFNMEATDRRNWGTFKFDYDDLKVNILSTPKDGEDVKSQKTVSFLVNKVLVNDSNPDAKGKYNIGNVNYTRVPEYPFFKTIWQSLLQGIVQSVGISPEREAKLLNLAMTSSKAVSGVKKGAKDVGKVAKDVGKVAGEVGKGVGKGVGKAAHGTDTFFKKLFKKKKKDED